MLNKVSLLHLDTATFVVCRYIESVIGRLISTTMVIEPPFSRSIIVLNI